MLEVVNELFPTTTNYTLNIGVDCFHYNLNFKKVGNLVYVDGSIQSKYTNIVTSIPLFNIPSGVLTPKRDTATIGTGTFDIPIYVLLDGRIIFGGGVNPEQIIYVNFHYQVND